MTTTARRPNPLGAAGQSLVHRGGELAAAWRARGGRAIVHFLATRVLRLRVEITGQEQIPVGESLIVAAGPHRSWLDPFLAIIALPTAPRLFFLGSAAAMFDTWWKRAILGAMGGIVPVDLSGNHHRDSLDTALAILARGDRLGVFPEGRGLFETDPTRLHPYKRGIAFLSQRSGCRVLPVAVAGTQRLRRGKTVRLSIGPPLPALAAGADRAAQAAFLVELQAATLAILPPQPPG